MSSPESRLGLEGISTSDAVTEYREAINNHRDTLGDAVLYDEGPVGSRPTSTVGTPGIAGRIYRSKPSSNPGLVEIDSGMGWDIISAPAYVTSLPSNPIDGQQVLYCPDPSGTREKWLLRYDSSKSGSYKWEVLHADPVVSNGPGSSPAQGSGFAALTGAPSYTPPLAGEYAVEFGFKGRMDPPSVYEWSLHVGVSPNPATDELSPSFVGAGVLYPSRHTSRTITSGAITLQAYIQSGLGWSGSVTEAWLRVSPKWVG